MALPPDPAWRGVYTLSMDIIAEIQSRAALQQTRRRDMAAHLTSVRGGVGADQHHDRHRTPDDVAAA